MSDDARRIARRTELRAAAERELRGALLNLLALVVEGARADGDELARAAERVGALVLELLARLHRPLLVLLRALRHILHLAPPFAHVLLAGAQLAVHLLLDLAELLARDVADGVRVLHHQHQLLRVALLRRLHHVELLHLGRVRRRLLLEPRDDLLVRLPLEVALARLPLDLALLRLERRHLRRVLVLLRAQILLAREAVEPAPQPRLLRPQRLHLVVHQVVLEPREHRLAGERGRRHRHADLGGGEGGRGGRGAQRGHHFWPCVSCRNLADSSRVEIAALEAA